MPTKARRGLWIPRAGVTDSCLLPHVCWESRPGPRQEQPFLLITEPSLWPFMYSSKHDREVAPMKSQQHGCLNKACIMTTMVNKSTQGTFQKAPLLDEELQAINGNWERENLLSPWKRPLIGYRIQSPQFRGVKLCCLVLWATTILRALPRSGAPA